MKVTVKHMERNEISGNVEGFTDVAIVDASHAATTEEALEYAYRWTNNVMGSWSIKKEYLVGIGQNGDYNDAVTVLRQRPDGMGQRSTMTFDRMEVNGIVYEVSMVGFKELGYVEEVA